MIRLGDGTELSHNKVQESLDSLWRYHSDLFYKDDIEEALRLGINWSMGPFEMLKSKLIEKLKVSQ